MSGQLSHLNERGEAHMVDVSAKPVSMRRATAAATISMRPETLEIITSGSAKKGDVLATARIAGIMAAKQTHSLIPLCHPLALSKVSVDFTVDGDRAAIDILATVTVEGKTGVEMEALTAATVAGLTIYDMCKAVDRGMIVSDVKLLEKTGGKSGPYRAGDEG